MKNPWVRHGLGLLVFGVAIYVLLPQLSHTEETWDALKRAEWPWLLVTFLFCVLTYLSAATSILGAAGRRLPIVRTGVAQLAADFFGRLAPAGVGSMATNAVYLTKAGLSKPAAAASITLDSLAGVVTHGIALVLFLLLARSDVSNLHLFPSDPDVPRRWIYLAIVVVALIAFALVRWGRRIHNHAVTPVKESLRSIRSTMQHPGACAALFGGSFAISMCHIFALYASAQAFDLSIGFAATGAIYLGASIIGAAVPTPGGLGALEAAIVAGMVAVAVPSGEAVATVLTYRLITYWLPIIPGAIAYRVLRIANAL